MADESLPSVSIIMPIRNEADFIERAIQSILDNDYPRHKMEVIVADGCSDDGTRAIVEKITSGDCRVRMLDNPCGIVPTALNIGLKACRGEIFIRIDGHAFVPPDFIRKSVKCLAEHPDAWVVGGYWKTVSQGYIGKVIAAATQTPVGVGGARHRLGNFDGWVDTVPYGAHHKWILDKVGYFDEELVRNQDDEFNMRIHLAGGKIWLSNSIWSTYYSRSSLKKLWRQYFQYGFWRIRTLQKHRRPATFRQIVPLLFVCSLIFLAVGGIVSQIFRLLLIGVLGIYTLGLACGSIQLGKQASWKYALLAPVVFVILHFAYGFGSLWGIIRFLILQGYATKKPEEIPMSR
jgi:glycosyltransferase involved in cell wall biosynthesis